MALYMGQRWQKITFIIFMLGAVLGYKLAQAMPATDFTPEGHASRYVTDCYAGMRDDVARTQAYRRAIATAAAGKIVLDIGTGGLALLALFAAESGAAHVYAFEVNEAAFESAKAAVAASAFADKVTVIQGFSTDPSVTIPVKANLVVHELIGEVAGEEGVVSAILDAAKRHLDPSAAPPLSIPSRSRSQIAPCELPDLATFPEYCAALPLGLLERPGQASVLKLPSLPRAALLAAPQTFEDLRFDAGAPAASQQVDLIFVAQRGGRLRGLCIDVDLVCSVDGVGSDVPEVSSAWVGSHWHNVIVLFEHVTPLTAGQRVRVCATCALVGPEPRYEFEAWLEEEVAQGAKRWSPLTRVPVCYPDAALNVNDAADAWMEQVAG